MKVIVGKKGFIEIIGAGIVLAIVFIGGLFIASQPKETITINDVKYVGNVDTEKVCSLSNDELSRIPEERRVVFQSLEDALKLGFKYSTACDLP